MKTSGRMRGISFIVFLALCLGQCSDPREKPLDPTTPKATQAWTLLLYNDADFAPGYDPTADFVEEMYGRDPLNVLILRDAHPTNAGNCNTLLHRPEDDATAAIFQADAEGVHLLKELGEVSMGKASTLAEFVRYAKTYFPAERYILAVYDHGAGFSGSCRDDTDSDWLDMLEMRDALRDSGGVDVLMFTAPCLMASLEAMFEVKDQAQFYIGSENTSGYCYWRHAMTDIRSLLQTSPGVSTLDFVQEVIRFMSRYRCIEYAGEEEITMSAVRSDRLDAVVSKFAEISRNYHSVKASQDRLVGFLQEHYTEAETYADFNMDLSNLAEKMALAENDGEAREAWKDLQDLIGQAVVAEVHGSEHPGSRGIAIFCPRKGSHRQQQQFSAYPSIRFAQVTSWDEILGAYLSGSPRGSVRFPEMSAGHDGLCPPRTEPGR